MLFFLLIFKNELNTFKKLLIKFLNIVNILYIIEIVEIIHDKNLTFNF